MEVIAIWIPGALIVIGAVIHIEVSIAELKTDIKWIKKKLNGG